MPHILTRLQNVQFEDIKLMLKEHAPIHAEQGMYVEHIWQNDDNSNEVIFLFRVDDLNKAKKFIKNVHRQALKENPHANLPQMTFLDE